MTFPRFRAAFYVALFALLVTFVMIVWGGIVKNTGSSMACPDWPLCRGQFIVDTSQMTEADKVGIFWEHGHRHIGTLIGILIITLCVMLYPPHPSGASVRRQALILLPIVIVQGLLGALTVSLNISGLASTFHLGLSMIFFLLLIRLCRRLYVLGSASRLALPAPAVSAGVLASAARVLGIALLVVYLQILLGAAVRHLGAVMSAGYGWEFSLVGMNSIGNHTFWPETAPAQLNVAHRYFAFITAAVVMFACVRAVSLLGQRIAVHAAFQLLLPIGLVLMQIVAGVVMLGLITQAEILLRTVHLAVGTLLLGVLGYGWFRLREWQRLHAGLGV